MATENGRSATKVAPTFDVHNYIAQYKGRTRIERLLLIGTDEARQAAVEEAKQGKDVGLYQAAVSALRVSPDIAWIDGTNKLVKAETDRLELELKGYKNNLIKESIRMGYDDLGQHYHRIGDLLNSHKAYQRMRDYCTTPSHIVIMSFRIIHVSVDQGNWLTVQSNVQKIRNAIHKNAETEKIQAKLSAAMGLAQLASSHYKDAALSFLDTDPRMIQAKLDDPNDEEAYNEIITPNDIALYGGLCALASMTRTELKTRVLENTKFRNYLELEPHIRRAISFFVSQKFSSCLSILDTYKSDYLMDLRLYRHINDIYSQIRSKAIVQQLVPFSSIRISILATAFNTSEKSIERELCDMIESGSIKAQIDLENGVLLARKGNERQRMHKEALEMSKDFKRCMQQATLRMETQYAGLEVRAPKSQGMGVGSLPSQGGFGNMMGDILSSEGNSKGKGLRSGGRF